MRVLTQNLWVQSGDWNARRALLREGIAALRPDVVGLQEGVKTTDVDTAAEGLGDDYAIHHQATGLLGDGNCAAIGSRWPLVHVEEPDLQLTPRTADFPATTLIATIEAPGGPLIYVNHLPSWKPELEYERERQTLIAARRVQGTV